jgi:hypothetical protein
MIIRRLFDRHTGKEIPWYEQIKLHQDKEKRLRERHRMPCKITEYTTAIVFPDYNLEKEDIFLYVLKTMQ